MNREIVIIMGYNASGKSTIVEPFVTGYARFNRDISNCSMEELHSKVDNYIKYNQHSKIVLDNTYPSVKSRKGIVDIAKKYNIPIRCYHLTTSMEDAQLNACLRMVKKVGRLLQPEEFKTINDPNLFPPVALFHYRKEFQPPTKSEGFSEIITIPFNRIWRPEYKNKALIVDYDGTLRLSTGPQKYPQQISEIQILPGRTNILNKYKKDGYHLLGVSNQSGIAKGTPREAIVACFEETNRLLGVKIDYHFCPHRIPPVSCYCRKPSTGLSALLIEKYKLKPSECIMVGDMKTDETFANRSGFKYIDVNDFFK